MKLAVENGDLDRGTTKRSVETARTGTWKLGQLISVLLVVPDGRYNENFRFLTGIYGMRM